MIGLMITALMLQPSGTDIFTEAIERAAAEARIEQEDTYTEDEELLMKVAMAEAEGEDVTGKALVMLVVLNRVASDEFPDTVEAVVYQDGQFSTVSNGRLTATDPDKGCEEALELISEWDGSEGALYFESCEGESWHSRNLELLFEHGNHNFYK